MDPRDPDRRYKDLPGSGELFVLFSSRIVEEKMKKLHKIFVDSADENW